MTIVELDTEVDPSYTAVEEFTKLVAADSTGIKEFGDPVAFLEKEDGQYYISTGLFLDHGPDMTQQVITEDGKIHYVTYSHIARIKTS